MLQVRNLRKAFGKTLLFEDLSFTMTPGERLGLVGRNGSGKTTLLRMILGEEEADDGYLKMPRGYRPGHLSQHLDFQGGTILEEACSRLPTREDGWQETHRAEATLMGLGFTADDFDRQPSVLSGGFQVRLQLAGLLVSEPNLLLLDEPTNYLDIVSIRWLTGFLRAWPGELIVVTHDRDFMDGVSTHTMGIHRRRVRRIEGGTDKLYDMLLEEEELHEKTRLNEEKFLKQQERFIERFRAKNTKAKAVQSRIKMLEKRERLEELQAEESLEFRFNAAPFPARFLIESDGLTFGYREDQPPLIQDLSFAIKKGDRVAVVGKNGKGKTTLVNLLAGELAPLSGSVTVNQNVRLAHFGQNNIDRLDPAKTVEEEILDVQPDHNRRAARGICGIMMFDGDDALKRVEVLSGGERARVLLGKLLVSPANLLLLDEPTNHLDMESVDSLIDAAARFPGAVLLVTHNQRVLHALATRLVVFDRGTVRVFEGTYRDFLERLGWADEDAARGARPQRPAAEKAPSPKDLRRARAKVVAERSRALRDLKQRLDRLEAQIVADEERLEVVNRTLCEASAGGASDDILTLSREFEELQSRIKTRFDEYHRLSERYQERDATFQRRLADL